MDNSWSQLPQQINKKDRSYLVKVFQLLSKWGITLLDEHEQLVSQLGRLSEINLGSSAKTGGYSQEVSSHSISAADHKKQVDILDIAAAYVDREGKWGMTPLHLAAEAADTWLVSLFIAAGANVNVKDVFNQTPLHFSANNGCMEVVETLLKAGANVNSENTSKQTPLQYSAENGFKEVLETLLKAGANLNSKDKYKQTPLHLSAQNGHKEIVETLLKAGADVDSTDMYHQTPLHNSIDFKFYDVADLLIQAGASVKTKDIWGYSVLSYMDKRQRAIFGFRPEVFSKYYSWEHSLTQEYNQNFASRNIKTEHTETISATFIDLASRRFEESHRTIATDSSINSKGQNGTSQDNYQILLFGRSRRRSAVISLGQNDTSRDSYQCLTSGTSPRRSAVISLGQNDTSSDSYQCLTSGTSPRRSKMTSKGQNDPSPDSSPILPSRMLLRRAAVTSLSQRSLSTSSTTFESDDLDDKDCQELHNIRQQVKKHLAQLSLETTGCCKARCSHDVEAAVQAGQIVIPITIKVTINKTTKKVKKIKHHYQPGTNVNINHADNVALHGHIVVHQIRKVTVDDDEDASSSDDDSYLSN